ncbi:MAG: DUF1592 domain-containing protein [Planctomycetes bacterium]|nr:DUF1592 domain-containing protein [Planctomycetota bacterium]
MMRTTLALGLLLVCRLAAADEPSYDRAIKPLLEKHCVLCHGPEKPKGDLRLDGPAPDLANAKVRGVWEKVHSMLVRGEMPPRERPKLSTDELDAMTTWIRRASERGLIAERGGAGRATMRRLTRVEYARLIEDVLDLRFANVPLSLVQKLPNDPQTELPINDGDLLAFQSLHWRSYADVADRAVAVVLAGEPRPEPWSYRFEARGLGKANVSGFQQGEKGFGGNVAANEKEIKRAAKVSIGVTERNPDGSTTLPAVYRADPGYLGRDKMNAGSWVLELPYVEPRGVLRLRIRAGSIVPKGEGVPLLRVAFHNNAVNQIYGRQLAEIPIDNSAEQLREYEVEIPLDLIEFPYVLFERSKTIGVRISNDTMPIADREKPTGPKGKPVEWPYQESKIVIDSVEVYGPGAGEWPPRRHRRLTAAGESAKDDRGRAAAIFADVAGKAWRRTIAVGEMAPFLKLYDQRRQAGDGADAALKLPLTAILSSPHAIYLVEHKAETVAPLAGIELANRLSFFLWGRAPDDELRRLASEGRLSDPKTLAAQVDRLLDDPRSAVFADDFVGRLLALERVINDPIEFKLTLKSLGSEKVAALREARLKHDLAEEPARFFANALRKNEPVHRLIDSDTLLINDRLARYYGIDGVDGPAFREVPAPENRRAGWLSMAGVMAAASRGNKEATIHRGVYLLQRFLGEHPGTPPGNVEPLEVQAKGDAKRKQMSIREQVKLHTSINTCQLCHRKIDPLGFVWADFDELGQQVVKKGKDLGPVDCSGIFPDGRSFKNLTKFAEILKNATLDSRFQFGEILLRQLTAYALGRPLYLNDDELIRELAQRSRSEDWRLRAMIRAIVLSKAFTHG